MVMELLKGDTLNDYLKRVHTLSLETTLDFMAQMCEGLAVAHVHGIFHRDIKPGNIFVQNDGSLKVLDFGVARLAESNMTASGFIVGTPDFMSPEQARGAEVDHRSDIFSTGAVFYYMLSGRKPFAATDLPAVLHKVEAEDPLPLTDREAPTGLWQIISKALAKSLTRRYQELGELLTDLTHFQRDTTVSRVRKPWRSVPECSRCSVRCISVRTMGRARPTRISSASRFASDIRCSKTRAPMRWASSRSGVRPCTRSKRRSNTACRCSCVTPRAAGPRPGVAV